MQNKERRLETLIAWILAASFGGMFFVTTKADIVDKAPYDTYRLSYFTTPLGSELFSFAFERMSEQLCPRGYQVVDKLEGAGYSRTVWLISCSIDKGTGR